jgi:hypothetical protein
MVSLAMTYHWPWVFRAGRGTDPDPSCRRHRREWDADRLEHHVAARIALRWNWTSRSRDGD